MAEGNEKSDIAVFPGTKAFALRKRKVEVSRERPGIRSTSRLQFFLPFQRTFQPSSGNRASEFRIAS